VAVELGAVRQTHRSATRIVTGTWLTAATPQGFGTDALLA